LDSIIHQSFKGFEIIIVDGCSADNTLELVNNHFAKNDFIEFKIISEKDNGIYDAMNKGISLAKGDFFYFMGSDDLLYSSDVLQKVNYHILKFKHVDLFYGDIIRFDESGMIKDQFVRTYSLYNSVFVNKIIIFLKLGLCHQAFFARRELFYTKFSLKFKLISDLDWILNIVEMKKRFRHMDITVAKFNVSGTSSNLKLLFEELESLFANHYGRLFGWLFRTARKQRWMTAINTIQLSESNKLWVQAENKSS
jgi:glycosyltransferase involved in cell wall biosynthesis